MTSAFLLSTGVACSQTIGQQKMALLSYMVGEWVGTSTTYKGDTIYSQVPAYEHIQCGLDGNIMIIDLRSETLQLHTIIHYIKEDSTYYYQPFSIKGTGKYKATFEEDKLVVRPNDQVRYIFTSNSECEFMEYGEKLIDGEWVKYFEDVFSKM